jgi:hypothetical protein
MSLGIVSDEQIHAEWRKFREEVMPRLMMLVKATDSNADDYGADAAVEWLDEVLEGPGVDALWAATAKPKPKGWTYQFYPPAGGAEDEV